ncbi:recombinase family protein [Sphingomonas kyungheensis]|uniref:Recombinase family protein n=1 Tax=Sphingomonas kyungheensis TaxID=1069987 RepID=A0ABU8H6B0_9SPHN
MTQRAVAYLRVSTARQGASGLGMEAQREAVEAVCRERGWDLVAPPFVEVESGKRADRPELAKAINRAQLMGAKLVIAKLDRLSRDAEFLLKLQRTGVDFVAADMPHADRFTVTIMAALAEKERELISVRTKSALAAAKVRGVQLGNPNGAAALHRAGKGNAASALSQAASAQKFAERLRDTVEELKGRGVVSLGAIAAELNAQGYETPRKGKWHASSVRNLVARLDGAAAGKVTGN